MNGSRAVAAGVAAGLLLPPLLAVTPGSAAAPQVGAKINRGKAPCNTVPDLTGTKPGELLKYKELKVDSSLLKGARMFRVLYTTSGVDERHVQVSCGLVVLPAKTKDRRNQVIAYAHGTAGMHQSCQPSNDPTAALKALGPISYGQGRTAVQGSPRKGILQGIIDQGRMVTATDYYSGLGQPASAQQNYVLGVPAGAATLDSVRAGVQLQQRLSKGKPRTTWKVATWGVSQGGHAAMWAGQLADQYLRATRLPQDPAFKPVGVAAIVPASSFVATEQTPADLVGRHLGDLEMHEPALVVNGRPTGNMGALLFSLVVTSWAKYPGSGTLTPDAAFPGYPASVPLPRMSDVLTGPGAGDGQAVATNIAAGCLNAGLALQTNPYNQPAENAFFVQPMWGGPARNGQWAGQIDSTCLNPGTDPMFDNWCTWLAYNQPGPDRQNPFPKFPMRADGSHADVLIAEGMADNVVWCVHPGKQVPAPGDCLARQLYDALAPACADANVKLDLFARTKRSPASHGSTYMQIADNGKAAYKGSRLDRFFRGAFADSMSPGCKATVVNR